MELFELRENIKIDYKNWYGRFPKTGSFYSFFNSCVTKKDLFKFLKFYFTKSKNKDLSFWNFILDKYESYVDDLASNFENLKIGQRYPFSHPCVINDSYNQRLSALKGKENYVTVWIKIDDEKNYSDKLLSNNLVKYYLGKTNKTANKNILKSFYGEYTLYLFVSAKESTDKIYIGKGKCISETVIKDANETFVEIKLDNEIPEVLHKYIDNSNKYEMNKYCEQLNAFPFAENEDLDKICTVKQRKEQGRIRSYFRNKNAKIWPLLRCSICSRTLDNSLIWMSHIKTRSSCDKEEIKDYKNNVLPMCKLGCDDLFEKGYIYVDDKGFIKKTDKVSGQDLNNFVDSLLEKNNRIVEYNEKNAKYFKYRKESFKFY